MQKLETKDKRNPYTIDDTTWFYSDSKSVDFVHEIYENDKFVRSARFSIPQSLIDQILSQSDSPEQLRALIQYLPAIVSAECGLTE